jgi:radical SAM-linked protein
MNDKELFRYRLEYAKTSAMCYTGHLDVLRAWERTFRRAEIPLAFTQGFNPRPRINMVAALPLGFTSECELMELWLMEDLESSQLQNQIKDSLPPGLMIYKVIQVPNKLPKLQKVIQAAEYDVYLDPFPANKELQKKIDQLLDSQEITRIRRGKTYDLRPLVESLKIIQTKRNSKIQMRLSSQEAATGRPEEVLLELEMDPSHAAVHRIRLILDERTQ